jgi:hypothetical protein
MTNGPSALEKNNSAKNQMNIQEEDDSGFWLLDTTWWGQCYNHYFFGQLFDHCY